MREFLKKWDLSAIYQIALVILDVCFINLCSVAALLVRFELSAVPVEYWESVRSMMIPNTIVTIGILPYAGFIEVFGDLQVRKSSSILERHV